MISYMYQVYVMAAFMQGYELTAVIYLEGIYKKQQLQYHIVMGLLMILDQFWYMVNNYYDC